jgi:predicted ABC-type ATPase
MIIHISGPPGSGKTTLGNKLQAILKNKIIIKDLDDLFNVFMKKNKKFKASSYQKYIDVFIAKNRNKCIIFVGLNKDHTTNTFYNIHADHKFYIKLAIKTNVKRHFNRELNSWLAWMKNRDHIILYNQITKNEKSVVKDLTKSLKRTLEISKQQKFILSFNKIYSNKKYIFLSSDTIYKRVMKLVKC